MRLFCPAKVNLFLQVVGKRKDGYHEIVTLFERVSLGDTLTLRPAKEIKLTVSGQKIPPGPKNLVLRAAELLQTTYGVKKGAHLKLHKRIPISAGLGGGSSDAAATLLGLDRLWKLRLSQAALLKLAAQIGSDVPFFILGTPFAIGRGRGEKLEALPVKKVRFWHVLVKPAFGISTKEAYGALGGRFLTLPEGDVRMLVRSIRNGDPSALAGLLSNSLEVALNKRVTKILKIKKSLLAGGALGTLLSGSGSCVFGLFSTEIAARRAARRLRQSKHAWKVTVASTY